jgi:hypothetical protein
MNNSVIIGFQQIFGLRTKSLLPGKGSMRLYMQQFVGVVKVVTKILNFI